MSKTYLITGAGGGIGSAIARTIANNIDSGTILLHYNGSFDSVKKLQQEIQRENVFVETI